MILRVQLLSRRMHLTSKPPQRRPLNLLNLNLNRKGAGRS